MFKAQAQLQKNLSSKENRRERKESMQKEQQRKIATRNAAEAAAALVRPQAHISPVLRSHNRFTHRVPSVQIVCKPKRVFAFLAKLQSCHAKQLLVMQAAVRTSIMHWGLCATPNCLTCRAETEGSRVNCSDRAAQVLDCPRRV